MKNNKKKNSSKKNFLNTLFFYVLKAFNENNLFSFKIALQ